VTIETKVVGGGAQAVICQLGRDDGMYAEPGRFLWKTVNVAVESRTARLAHVGTTAAAASAGPLTSRNRLLHKALATASEMGKRVLPGEAFTLHHFHANGEGLVAFAAAVPATLRALEVDSGHGWFVERDGFVAAESSVDIGLVTASGTEARRIALQRFTGTGTVVVAAAGELLEVNPERYGGILHVDTGAVVAFEDRLAFTVERGGAAAPPGSSAGSGPFGSTGVLMATVEGDGQVILQTGKMIGVHALETLRAAGDDRQRGGLLGAGND
jgi:uncharacterized protein (AIM24 family)